MPLRFNWRSAQEALSKIAWGIDATELRGPGWGLTNSQELIKIFNCQLRNDAFLSDSETRDVQNLLIAEKRAEILTGS